MLAYKAFKLGLICLGHQFVMGKNTTTQANCRKNGYHCAENPLDCLTYYPNMEQSEYYLVNAGGDLDEDGTDSKISCTELTILTKLSREDFFLHALAYMVDHPYRKWHPKVQNSYGNACQGYAMVRGKNPLACGSLGDILAFAREEAAENKIVQVTLACVDGQKVLPGQWYDANLNPKEV